MASDHPTVTVQGRRMISLCAYPRVGGASCIRRLGTRSPRGKRTPGEDTLSLGNSWISSLEGTLHSVERVKYVINNLLHLVIVKYGVISLVLCISTRLRLMTILTSLMK